MCDNRQDKKESIRKSLHNNRQTLTDTLEDNEGVVCSYLINMFHRVIGKSHITPTDGKQ